MEFYQNRTDRDISSEFKIILSFYCTHCLKMISFSKFSYICAWYLKLKCLNIEKKSHNVKGKFEENFMKYSFLKWFQIVWREKSKNNFGGKWWFSARAVVSLQYPIIPHNSYRHAKFQSCNFYSWVPLTFNFGFY